MLTIKTHPSNVIAPLLLKQQQQQLIRTNRGPYTDRDKDDILTDGGLPLANNVRIIPQICRPVTPLVEINDKLTITE